MSEIDNEGMEQYFQQCRVLYLGGVINDGVCAKNMGGLLALNLISEEPVHLILNSPGGEASSLFALYDMIKAVSCPVWTFGIGSVMSAAVLLLASGDKGERRISPRTRLCIHSLSAGVNGTLSFMKTHMDEFNNAQKSYEDSLIAETKITKKEIAKLMNGEDHFFGAKEAVKYGIADKIVE